MRLRRVFFTLLAVVTGWGAYMAITPEQAAADFCNDLLPYSDTQCILWDNWFCTGSGGVCGYPCWSTGDC